MKCYRFIRPFSNPIGVKTYLLNLLLSELEREIHLTF